MKTVDLRQSHNETVSINKALVDLLPKFLKNKENEIIHVVAMIKKNDFNNIKNVGHKWKGTCPSYGFHYLGAVGEELELLADKKDCDGLNSLTKSLPYYLEHFTIEIETENFDKN
jgi:HPt (histidine-containing phosphotransfer) domain-containing protein